jgi:hypothetical protein
MADLRTSGLYQAQTPPSSVDVRFWLLADSICCGVECPLVTLCGHCPSTRKGSASTPHSAGFGEPFRDELLNGDIFYSLKEAQVLIERWRRHYNEVRLHSALGYRPPASRDIMPRRANPGFAVDGLRPGQHLTETVPRLT